MSFSLDELIVGARILRDLPGLLRRPLSVDGARADVQSRRERGPDDFLAMVSAGIYAQPSNPYCQLLDHVGCQPGDLKRLVASEGLVGTLQTLFRQGVYLSVDEFKGRRPVVRGSTSFTVDATLVRNPLASAHLRGRSGGSRRRRTPVALNLAYVRDWAADTLLQFHARGGDAWEHAVWDTPGRSSWGKVLRLAAIGRPPVRWYSQVALSGPRLDARYRRGAQLLNLVSALSGVRLPTPRYLSLDAPSALLDWVVETANAGRTPHVWTISSSAVRLCQAALDRGVDLTGVHFTVTSEPLTEARAAVIHAAGAEVVGNYGAAESGSVSIGCLSPRASDDSHVLDDLHAVIQAGDAAPSGLPPSALLLTSFQPTAPLLFMNLSMGDQAELSQRRCGCPLEAEGWLVHLERVRSFEKLTAGGMTFLDSDVIRVLEQTLPARFGGGPTHYQLVEEERPGGQSSLCLLVHPTLGPLDSDAIRDAFLDALGANSSAEWMMSQIWREGQVLRVERTPPQITATGKIQHLHLARLVSGAR